MRYDTLSAAMAVKLLTADMAGKRVRQADDDYEGDDGDFHAVSVSFVASLTHFHRSSPFKAQQEGAP